MSLIPGAGLIDLRSTRPKEKRIPDPSPRKQVSEPATLRNTLNNDLNAKKVEDISNKKILNIVDCKISDYGRNIDPDHIIRSSSRLNPSNPYYPSGSVPSSDPIADEVHLYSVKGSKGLPSSSEEGIHGSILSPVSSLKAQRKRNRQGYLASSPGRMPTADDNIVELCEDSLKRLHSMILNFLVLDTPKASSEKEVDHGTYQSNKTRLQSPSKASSNTGDLQRDQNQSSSSNPYQSMSGRLATNIDLHQYSLDSGSPITNLIVQEICLIQPNIETLNLSDCKEITDVSLWAIAKHCNPKSLRLLNLSGCHAITNIGLRSLSLKCYNIDTFYFNNCVHLDDLSLTVIASGGWKLKRLYLQNCRGITDTGISRIARVGTHIEVLDLNGCAGIGEFCDNALKEIGMNCGNLLELDISNCRRVDDHGLRAIAIGCTKLQQLRIQCNDYITGASLHEIFKNLNQLASLSLIKCSKLTDKDFEYLLRIHQRISSSQSRRQSVPNRSKTSSDANISEYSLNKSQKLMAIGDSNTQKSLMNQSIITSLRELNLSGCARLTDYTTKIISNTFSITLLKLNVSHNKNISNLSAKYLSEGCTKLQELDLTNCPALTDDAIEMISQYIKNITTLKLNNNLSITLKKLVEGLDNLDFAVISKQWLGYEPKAFATSMIETKEAINKKLRQIIAIQSIIRRKLAYKAFSLRKRRHIIRNYVPLFQALVRGHFQRKRYRRVLFQIQKIRMAVQIQAWFRKCLQRRKHYKIQEEIRDYYYDEYMSIKIQSAYRRYKARKYVQQIRYSIANKLLLEAKQAIKYEKKALIIQRYVRSYLAKLYVATLVTQKNFAESKHELESKAAVVIQCAVRKRLAQMQADLLLFEKRLRLKQWVKAREIQRVYRGYRGRVFTRNHAIFLQTQSYIHSYIIIQKYYRGFRARMQYKNLLRLRDLRVKQLYACVYIQRMIRGFLARLNYEKLYLLHKQEILERRSSIIIQKLYRGHKGREQLYILRELQKYDETITPLAENLKLLESSRDKLKVQVDKMLAQYNFDTEDMEKLEMELDYVMKTENKYCDSYRLTNYSQRFLTKYLRVRLKEFFEQKKASYDTKKEEIEKKMTELRALEGQIRAARREITPLEAGKLIALRNQRGAILRENIRNRFAAATKIQKFWRGALVRIAYKDPARDYWVECYDEDQSEDPFYFNTWNQLTSWEKPLAYRYFCDPRIQRRRYTDENVGEMTYLS